MSRARATVTGMVRRPRKIPPMPSVSPIVWRTPYRAGMSKSARVAAYPPTCTSLITYRAPASASRRSRVAVTVAPAPDCSDIRRASRSAWASRSALMSYSVSRSWPRNSG